MTYGINSMVSILCLYGERSILLGMPDLAYPPMQTQTVLEVVIMIRFFLGSFARKHLPCSFTQFDNRVTTG